MTHFYGTEGVVHQTAGGMEVTSNVSPALILLSNLMRTSVSITMPLLARASHLDEMLVLYDDRIIPDTIINIIKLSIRIIPRGQVSIPYKSMGALLIGVLANLNGSVPSHLTEKARGRHLKAKQFLYGCKIYTRTISPIFPIVIGVIVVVIVVVCG